MRRMGQWLMLAALLMSGLSCADQSSPPPISKAPAMGGGSSGGEESAAPKAVPGSKVTVKLETTKGDVVVELYPDWAPIGVARVKELVEIGYYNDVAFFRIVPDFVVQFGMSGDPALGAKWSENNLKDEPVKESNRRGYLTFAKSGAPDSRSTQLFINLKDNASLDAQGFSPIGRVVQGMDIVETFNAEYGEQPDQGQIKERGNQYLKPKFPKLDFIKKATIVTDEKPAPADAKPTDEKTEDVKKDDEKPEEKKAE